jgi:putative aldouronate transport system substrate-binding protein
MDKETFMQKDDQFLAKVSSGQMLAVYDQRWGIQNAFNAMDQSGVAKERAMVAFPVVVDSAKREYYRGPYALQAVGIAISISCQDPEGVMRYLNAFASDEVGKLAKWGLPGVDWTQAADGKFSRTPEQWQKSFDLDYQQSEGMGSTMDFLGPIRETTDDKTYGYFADGQLVNPNLLPEYAQLRYKDNEKQILKDYNINFLTDLFEPAYPGRYTPGYTIFQSSIAADSPERQASNWVLETAKEYHTKLAQAPSDEAFEKIWTEYRAKLATKQDLITALETVVTEKIKESSKYYEQ